MIKIEGIEAAMRAFKDAPEKMDKIILVAMRDACKPVVKDIKSKTPSRFKKLVKAKVKANRNNDTEAWVGLFNNKQKTGHQGKTKVDDWFKAYWMNYGTLENRDPNHTFQYPLKKHRKTKHNYPSHRKARSTSNKTKKTTNGKLGISPRNFYPYDKEMPQNVVDLYINALRASLKKQEAKLLQ